MRGDEPIGMLDELLDASAVLPQVRELTDEGPAIAPGLSHSACACNPFAPWPETSMSPTS
jgi:hypothetical protein